jgi:hypothetical protein
MLKDCTLLRSLYVKYRGGNETVIAYFTEQLFQPSTPILPMMPPIYGARAGEMFSAGISALKNCWRLLFSMTVSVAPNLETRKT